MTSMTLLLRKSSSNTIRPGELDRSSMKMSKVYLKQIGLAQKRVIRKMSKIEIAVAAAALN